MPLHGGILAAKALKELLKAKPHLKKVLAPKTRSSTRRKTTTRKTGSPGPLH